MNVQGIKIVSRILGGITCLAILNGCDLEKVVIGEGSLSTNPTSTTACETPSPTCTAFPEDSTVVVTAEPADGWAFAGWEGTCPETELDHIEKCVQFMDEHKSVTARFVPIAAGNFTEGQWYYGRNSYTQYRAGNMPLVLVVSHGGKQLPTEIPNRANTGQYPSFNTSSDTNSRILADSIATQMFEYTGRYPHIVVNDLHRIKLDANRDIGEAALGNSYAERAWEEFNAFIQVGRSESAQTYNYGLVVDVHGYTDSENPNTGLIQLGYLISNNMLRDDPSAPQNTITDEMFDLDASYSQNSSIRHLHERSGHSFSTIMRGNYCIGGVFEYGGLPAIPSPLAPHTSPGYQFAGGGYITQTHGSNAGGVVDAIQIEFPFHLRQTEATATQTGTDTAAVLYNFMLTNYSF
ncbi:MAG: hypothetical protein K6L76_04935 [Agarilytica sp.]